MHDSHWDVQQGAMEELRELEGLMTKREAIEFVAQFEFDTTSEWTQAWKYRVILIINRHHKDIIKKDVLERLLLSGGY